MSYLYKDYQMIEGVLVKRQIDESKHLLHMYGSVPAIDKKVWDEVQARGILIRTNRKRVFSIDRERFNKNKIEIDMGFGKQYVVEKKYWTIKEPQMKLL